MSEIPTGEDRRGLKWQLALYVGLIRGAMFINIWIVAMQRIPTGIAGHELPKMGNMHKRVW